jgi:hypothetical protein
LRAIGKNDRNLVMPMKRTFLLIAFEICFAFLLCCADEYVDSKSPDEKLALHVTREDKQPFRQTDALVERATRKMIVDLDKDQPFDPEAKLSWTSDSQRFTYVRRTNEEDGSVATRIFQRNGATFDEIKLPDLPSPKMPVQAPQSEKQQVRIKPIRWSDASSLELEYEIITDSGWRGAERISLKFDRQSPPKIVKSEAEPVSIIDYFLLLPDKTLETAPRDWLHNATIDKENGYMSVSGDGAQPSFEVALFRYRDRRPLLALCEGELEGDNSVSLNFYELGSDGKMRSAPRNISQLATPLATTRIIRNRHIGISSCRNTDAQWWFEV